MLRFSMSHDGIESHNVTACYWRGDIHMVFRDDFKTGHLVGLKVMILLF